MDLAKGSLGFLVRMLQEDLNLVGQSVTVDGIYGPETEAAVKAFQQAQGITKDGIFGPETEGKMEVAITTARQQLRDEANHRLLGTVSGQVVGSGFYFDLPVRNQVEEMVDVLWLCDTGCAPDMLVTSQTAQQLALPNLGPDNVSGIGGSQNAHNSRITFELGDNKFTLPCIVDESVSFGINLFGSEWPAESQMTVKLDWHAQTLSFYAYIVPQTGNPPPGASYSPPAGEVAEE